MFQRNVDAPRRIVRAFSSPRFKIMSVVTLCFQHSGKKAKCSSECWRTEFEGTDFVIQLRKSNINEAIVNLVRQGIELFHTNVSREVNSIFSMDTFQIMIILLPSVVAVILFVKHRLISHKKYESMRSQNSKAQNNTNAHRLSAKKAKCLIDHKHLLDELHSATDNCYDKICALRCIDIVAYCPYLMNVQAEPYGLTPFHRVCLRGHVCLMEYMLLKGADPFLTTKTGENSLCLAIYHCFNNPMKDDFTCINILHTAGCHFSLNDNWYKTILKTTTRNNNKKLAEWLMLHASPSKVDEFTRCLSVPSVLGERREYITIH